MKKKAENWQQYFPEKYSPRPEQIEAIEFSIKQFQTKKFVILECPTGVGKSAIAYTLAGYFNGMYDKKNDEDARTKAYIVTTQIILQEQYKNDFPDLANIYSKNNYTCGCDISDFSMTCNEGLRTLSFLKKKEPERIGNLEYCSYMKDFYRFLSAPISLTNLSYLLFNRYFSASVPDRKLLIIDECHNVEKTITDFTSIEISEKSLDVFDIDYPNNLYTEEDYGNWLGDKYYKSLTNLKKRLETQLITVIKKEEKNPAAMLKLLHRVESEISLVEYFVSVNGKIKWAVTIDERNKFFSFKPLESSDFSSYIFDIADNVLLMSGTILNKEVFCEGLGIDVDDCAFLSIPSPFPKENRPVLIRPCGSMSYSRISGSLPLIAKGIKEILEHHQGEKGIIHTHTYKIFEYLEQNIHSDRLIFAKQNDRQKAIEKHLSSGKPTVLVSPSLTEGLNLKGELSRFQILCKIPFPYLGDTYISRKKENFEGWYEIQTVKTIVQALGRSIRNKDDYAVSYVLDSDWNFFYRQNRHFFPEWFQESIA